MKNKEQEWRRMSARRLTITERPFPFSHLRVALHVPLAVTVELAPLRVLFSSGRHLGDRSNTWKLFYSLPHLLPNPEAGRERGLSDYVHGKF